MMTRDELLSVGKRRIEKREVPGIGEVCLRSLSEAEWSQYQRDSMDLEKQTVSAEGLLTAKARLISLVVADEQGTRLFKNADLELLNAMDARVVGDLYAACEDFCGVMGDEGKN